MEQGIIQNNEENTLSWEIPEYVKHERGRRWYVLAVSAAALFVLFALLTHNFLFAVIIIICSAVIYLNEIREPEMIRFSLFNQGITVGKKTYLFSEFKDFSILYKPHEDLRSLYFEFKNGMKPRLSISLEEQNPLLIRKYLLRYLPEDLDRVNMPWSEGLARLFKL